MKNNDLDILKQDIHKQTYIAIQMRVVAHR